jgi:NAD(P)-dependent dehydrogenase (short-subunit alcohol dehydrogenase family)
MFSLLNRIAFITGGAGLLGVQHGRAIKMAGGIPVICDINPKAVDSAVNSIGHPAFGVVADITDKSNVVSALNDVVARFGKVDILVNNAARNPKVESSDGSPKFSRFENLLMEEWDNDISVGLTGAMLCSQVFGGHMANNGGGVIVNIGSEYSLIAPNQTVYRVPGLPDHLQPSKPITYTVIKHAIIGLTRHLAVYWADKGIRVNCLCPGGIEQGQDSEFKSRMRQLIPMGRMAKVDEMQGALVFLCSDASSFMTGETLAVNGGRTCW